MDELSQHLQGKRLLILGLGREGRNSLNFIRERQINLSCLGLADQNPKSLEGLDLPSVPIQNYVGADYLRALGHPYDIVLKAPGIPLRDEERISGSPQTLARHSNLEISGQADLFLRFSRAQIVGVSGTKGKSTTTTLLYQMMRQSHTAYLRGNIGVPPLEDYGELGEESLCALELSCHQLEFVRRSPRLAILTNLFPEHLDHYRDYAHYVESKLHLIDYPPEAGMWVIVPAEDPFVIQEVQRRLTSQHQVAWLQRTTGPQIPLNMREEDEHFLLDIERKVLQGPCGLEQPLPQGPGLRAEHLLLDAALAGIAARKLDISSEDIERACSQYRGLPHRCEALGVFRGRYFYNDSIATIPHATLLAIRSLDHPSTLIAGGMDRGLDLSELIDGLPTTSIRNLILLPETGASIAQSIENKKPGRFAIRLVQTMKEAVEAAYAMTEVGETILLSPAAASYNVYKNFEERGDDFRAEVARQGGERDTSEA